MCLNVYDICYWIQVVILYIYTYYLNIWNWFAYIICYCLHSKMTNYLTNTKGYMIHYSHEYSLHMWIFNIHSNMNIQYIHK
jgi:hypothetical protein